jgi:cytoskeletal protein CcmA (bactofilin family)
VTAGEVKVFGRVEGKITSEKCELKEKSRLQGDIKTKNLSMDPGASMSGRTEIGS